MDQNTMLRDPKDAGLQSLFLDLNSYFASVEQQENPDLRGRPVAVVPMDTESTCAIAASYEAKAYGIKTGTRIYEAKAMCPHLVCVLARHDIYVDYHNRIKEEVERHIPIEKTWSVDEFSIRLIGREKQEENTRQIAQNIKDGICRNIGPAITCSIGIAPNSFLAKVGTEMQKPDGLVILKPEDLPGPLFNLKLTDLPGIGMNMEKRLNRAGVTTIRQLWALAPKQARKIWGSVQGEKFWYWLHGYDVPHLETSTGMVGHSRILDPAMRNPEDARLMARRLLVKASARLRRKGFHAGALSLGVTNLQQKVKWRKELRFPPAQDPFTFLYHLESLWDEMMHDFFGPPSHWPYRRSVFKKVSTLLHGLKRSGDITGDLFQTQFEIPKQEIRRRNALTGAIDSLNKKYQREMVLLGTTPKTQAGHVGTKIAFSRVPDMAEFHE